MFRCVCRRTPRCVSTWRALELLISKIRTIAKILRAFRRIADLEIATDGRLSRVEVAFQRRGISIESKERVRIRVQNTGSRSGSRDCRRGCASLKHVLSKHLCLILATLPIATTQSAWLALDSSIACCDLVWPPARGSADDGDRCVEWSSRCLRRAKWYHRNGNDHRIVPSEPWWQNLDSGVGACSLSSDPRGFPNPNATVSVTYLYDSPGVYIVKGDMLGGLRWVLTCVPFCVAFACGWNLIRIGQGADPLRLPTWAEKGFR